MPYHHGDLRRALLDTALEAVGEQGPAALSLRDVARRAGVSHAAPTHHFRDKTALLTALAAEGWALLADSLRDAAADGDFAELGVAYVVFATSHPAHFAVMRAPGLARADDPELEAAMGQAREQLESGVRRFEDGSTRDAATTALAAWSLVHGLAALVLEGAVPLKPDADVAELARAVTSRLHPPT
ncbi:TetR/AcrR family transcriptional regulator [Pseudonocardia adelaidensis]|uniref:TetR/AcrR family transcriptional regulator n=1 Tax=Pseudonocardia adelaidensis TaxID=648754 RepID=A0ABP9NIX8_9PSEU